MSEESNTLKHIELLAVRILEELQGIRAAINELEYHKVSLNLHEKVEKTFKKEDGLTDDDEFIDEDELGSEEDIDDDDAENEDWVNFNSEVIGAIIDESDYATDLDAARINKKIIIPKLLVKYGKEWKEKYDVSTTDIISQIKQGIKEIEEV